MVLDQTKNTFSISVEKHMSICSKSTKKKSKKIIKKKTAKIKPDQKPQPLTEEQVEALQGRRCST